MIHLNANQYGIKMKNKNKNGKTRNGRNNQARMRRRKAHKIHSVQIVFELRMIWRNKLYALFKETKMNQHDIDIEPESIHLHQNRFMNTIYMYDDCNKLNGALYGFKVEFGCCCWCCCLVCFCCYRQFRCSMCVIRKVFLKSVEFAPLRIDLSSKYMCNVCACARVRTFLSLRYLAY